jgi:hypothetical protein
MLALQSSPTFDLTKIAYLVGVVVCLAGAVLTVARIWRTPAVAVMLPWLISVAALAGLLAISFFVARANGTPNIDWVRDIAAYALFAAVPVFALDAHGWIARRHLVIFLVVAGLLGGVSWAVEWLARREIVDLPLARLVFPSGQLPGMLYVFAMATALTATGAARTRWASLAGVILALFLLTGTRSSLVLLLGPLAMVIVLGRHRLRTAGVTIISHAVVAGVVVLAFQASLVVLAETGPLGGDGVASPPPGASAAATPHPNVLGERVGSLPSLLANPAGDASMRERIAQYQASWALFISSPLVGVGPGHRIEWVDVSGFPRDAFTADTPLVMPAKFGIAGVAVFAGVTSAYVVTLRRMLRLRPRSAVTMALLGYGVTTFVGLPLGFPIEDKGAGLALILLLALTLYDLVPVGSVRSRASAETSARPDKPRFSE